MTRKTMLTIRVTDEGGQPISELLMDQIHVQTTDRGTILVACSDAHDGQLTPADFLTALARAKHLKPQGPEWSHLPAGVYTTLLQNAAIPLEKGATGGPGVHGYYVSHDPEDAVTGILEALRGDAWEAEESDVAGELGTDGDAVKVLFKRMQ